MWTYEGGPDLRQTKMKGILAYNFFYLKHTKGM